ncbi:MAG: hypothetical protein EXQ57_01875 [Bryobacterales bacterium]|nr:hypothetical protein [Bryobacterales bacterium]
MPRRGCKISTPLSTHFPVTRDALLAGKHVFCEKSLAHKPEEIHMPRKLVNAEVDLAGVLAEAAG